MDGCGEGRIEPDRAQVLEPLDQKRKGPMPRDAFGLTHPGERAGVRTGVRSEQRFEPCGLTIVERSGQLPVDAAVGLQHGGRGHALDDGDAWNHQLRLAHLLDQEAGDVRSTRRSQRDRQGERLQLRACRTAQLAEAELGSQRSELMVARGGTHRVVRQRDRSDAELLADMREGSRRD